MISYLTTFVSSRIIYKKGVYMIGTAELYEDIFHILLFPRTSYMYVYKYGLRE